MKIKKIFQFVVTMAIAANFVYAANFPAAGEWYVDATTKTYTIKIDTAGKVFFWKDVSQLWCEAGRAYIFEMTAPVPDARNKILLFKCNGDIFKCPYVDGQKVFKGLSLLKFTNRVGEVKEQASIFVMEEN